MSDQELFYFLTEFQGFGSHSTFQGSFAGGFANYSCHLRSGYLSYFIAHSFLRHCAMTGPRTIEVTAA